MFLILYHTFQYNIVSVSDYKQLKDTLYNKANQTVYISENITQTVANQMEQLMCVNCTIYGNNMCLNIDMQTKQLFSYIQWGVFYDLQINLTLTQNEQFHGLCEEINQTKFNNIILYVKIIKNRIQNLSIISKNLTNSHFESVKLICFISTNSNMSNDSYFSVIKQIDNSSVVYSSFEFDLVTNEKNQINQMCLFTQQIDNSQINLTSFYISSNNVIAKNWSVFGQMTKCALENLLLQARLPTSNQLITLANKYSDSVSLVNIYLPTAFKYPLHENVTTQNVEQYISAFYNNLNEDQLKLYYIDNAIIDFLLIQIGFSVKNNFSFINALTKYFYEQQYCDQQHIMKNGICITDKCGMTNKSNNYCNNQNSADNMCIFDDKQNQFSCICGQFFNITTNCQQCINDYVEINKSCYKFISNDSNGLCVEINNQKTCECYVSFLGEFCQFNGAIYGSIGALTILVLISIIITFIVIINKNAKQNINSILEVNIEVDQNCYIEALE